MERSSVDNENPSSGEGGDVELCAWTSKQVSCICDCFFFCFTLLAITYTCVLLWFALAIHCYHHLYLSIFALSIKKAIDHLNTISREIQRRSSRALHNEFDFTYWFELTVCIIHFIIVAFLHYWQLDYLYSYSSPSRCTFSLSWRIKHGIWLSYPEIRKLYTTNGILDWKRMTTLRGTRQDLLWKSFNSGKVLILLSFFSCCEDNYY